MADGNKLYNCFKEQTVFFVFKERMHIDLCANDYDLFLKV